jgi:hypothetical protein
MVNHKRFQAADSASLESNWGSNDPPRQHAQRVHTGNSPPSISQALPSANHTALTEENLLGLDLDSMTMPSDNIEVFAYENGKTEYGPLVATRACSSDYPRFSRFIVYSGLDEPGAYHSVTVPRECTPKFSAASDTLDHSEQKAFNSCSQLQSLVS